jgi:D-alanyl-lipoteichoic acid acyltransferase DltB (MBOAT superfamily)
MLFSSTIFIIFFLPTVLFAYYFCARKTKTRNIVLLLSSLVFYAYGEPWFVLVMICSIFANYYFGLAVYNHRGNHTRSRKLIVAMLGVNLGILFIFKYLTFTLDNVNRFFGTSVIVPDILLPIGISFFTFQGISYVLDIYRQVGHAQRNPLYTGLYISLFPQLIAGPIVRYQTVARQIEGRTETIHDFSEGVCRFIIGLSKKVLIANSMALIADKSFSMQGAELSVSFAWLGIIAYAFQIFYDFSGYSDMAIGLGRMFGFHYLENFNYPYISKSVTEFWRRWHISLSSWFKDYVYYSLGGSRVASYARLLFNLFVVWFLTGFWHGANWTFIIWGLFYFLLLAIEKLSGYAKTVEKRQWAIWGHVYLILITLLGWVLFRSDNISHAMYYFKAMFKLNGNLIYDDITYLYFSENIIYLLFAVLLSMPVGRWLKKNLRNLDWPALPAGLNRYVPAATHALLGCAYPILMTTLFVLCISYIVVGTHNPFIYFNF